MSMAASATRPAPVSSRPAEQSDDPYGRQIVIGGSSPLVLPPALTQGRGPAEPVDGNAPPRLVLPWPVPPGYEPLAILGRSEKGVIYKARALRLGRLAVLKVLLPGAAGSLEERIRWQIEMEAVACLQHPNVVPIHEVGEHEGCPFLALEHVEGSTLATLCRAPQRGMAAHRRSAQLVATLARAVHHAHQRGILHGDLKPAKVRLTPDGTAQITDFGMARRHGSAAEPAADVHGLGTILHELLTGQPPGAGALPRDALRCLPRELWAICQRCLDSGPARRYASAEALADELERFVQGRSVGPWEHGRKWGQHRLTLAALVLVGGALAWVGLLASVAQETASRPPERQEALQAKQEAVIAQQRAERARKEEARARQVAEHGEQEAQQRRRQVEKERAEMERQRDQARAQREQANQQNRQAQRQAELARQQRDQAQVRWRRAGAALEQLVDALTHPPRAGASPEDPAQRQVLEAALRSSQDLLREMGSDSFLSQDRAGIHRRVGDLERLLGKREEAVAAYEKALALLRPAIQAPAARAELARVLTRLGAVQAALGQAAEAQRSYRQAIEEGQKLAGAFPDQPVYRQELGQAYLQLGLVLGWKAPKEAEAAFRAALDLRRKLADASPRSAEYRSDLAVVLHNLAILLAGRAESQEARRLLEEAITHQQAALQASPGQPAYQAFLRNHQRRLADVLVQLGEPRANAPKLVETYNNQQGTGSGPDLPPLEVGGSGSR
jgi:tetratricopeptide (TPR) repeat protein/tRNA A-37 threonylcarbamoyl transferase component Bud32